MMFSLNGLGQAGLETLNQTELQGIFITDHRLDIQAWNRWMEMHSGLPAHQVVGKNIFKLYPSLAERRLDGLYQEALRGQVAVLAQRFHHYLLPLLPVGTDAFPYMRQTDRIMPLREQDRVIGTITFIEDERGRVTGTLSSGDDITDRKAMEAALVREAKITAALAELSQILLTPITMEGISAALLSHAKHLTDSPLGFVGYIDLQTGYLGSPSLIKDVGDVCRMTDKTAVFKELRGLHGWVVQHKQPLLTNRADQDPRSTGVPAGHLPIRRFLAVPALFERQLVGEIAVANAPRDYTEADQAVLQRLAVLYAMAVSRLRLEEELRALAVRDQLTGLFNRRGFFTLAEQALKQARRSQSGVWLLFADLDGMKEINDTLGHAAGDEALRQTAAILQDAFREADIIGRLGGDEFALLAPQSDTSTGEFLKNRLLEKIDHFNAGANLPYRLSLSIGLAFFDPQDPGSLDEFMSRADLAMYAHKKSKGNPRRRAEEQAE